VTNVAIEARGLTKQFGSILALDRLDLIVPAGSIFGLLGPNGAGKTTTIRILTGLARPTSGSASVAEVDVGLDQPELRRRLGYLDQDPRFYGWMKGRELLSLIAGLRGEATVVFSTHVLSDVERICDRVAILDRGRLVAEGPLEALLAAHARPIYRLVPAPRQAERVGTLVQRLRAAPWATNVTAGEDLVRVTVADPDAAAAAILPLVVAADVSLDSFERARPTLEDVFLELVGPASPDELDGRGFIRAREASPR